MLVKDLSGGYTTWQARRPIAVDLRSPTRNWCEWEGRKWGVDVGNRRGKRLPSLFNYLCNGMEVNIMLHNSDRASAYSRHSASKLTVYLLGCRLRSSRCERLVERQAAMIWLSFEINYCGDYVIGETTYQLAGLRPPKTPDPYRLRSLATCRPRSYTDVEFYLYRGP